MNKQDKQGRARLWSGIINELGIGIISELAKGGRFMKRFMVLALMAAFILGTVGVASAAELKVRGDWRVHLNHIDNPRFDGAAEHDEFRAAQRVRLIFEFITSENLKGVMELETANIEWGKGPGIIETTTGVVTRQAFLDFFVPDTKVNVKAGYQPIALPSTLGSYIYDARSGAVVVSSPIADNVDLTLGWARPRGDEVLRDDDIDVFFGVVPMTFDGVKLNPFVVVSQWDKNIHHPLAARVRDKDSTMWHSGLNFRMTMFDPIVILGDLNYGSVDWGRDMPGISAPGGLEQSGWAMLLAAQYAMDMVTPRIWFGYETGEESNFQANIRTVHAIESKRMPQIAARNRFGPTAGFGDKSSFAAYNTNQLRTLLVGLGEPLGHGVHSQDKGAVGLWHVGFALRDIKSIDKLSHELIWLYAEGTNHRNNWTLFTTEDNYWEVNLNTTYRIYKNLALILELAYGQANLEAMTGRKVLAEDDLFRGVLGMRYRF